MYGAVQHIICVTCKKVFFTLDEFVKYNLELPQRLVNSPKIDQNSVTDQQNDKYNDSGPDPSKLKFLKAIVFVVE